MEIDAQQEKVEGKIITHYIEVIQADLRKAKVRHVNFKEDGINFSLKYHDVDIIIKVKER